MPNLFPNTWGADYGYSGFGGWGGGFNFNGSHFGGTDIIDKAWQDSDPRYTERKWSEGDSDNLIFFTELYSYSSSLQSSSGPQILFGPAYRNLIPAFREAFDNARNRVSTKKDCADLFGGKEKALAKLDSASYRLFDSPVKTTFKNGKLEPSVTGAFTAEGNTVFINLSGPFFNGPVLSMGGNRTFRADFGTGLKGANLAALLLLHELGHQVGKWGKDGGVGDQDKNLQHSMAVFNRCF